MQLPITSLLLKPINDQPTIINQEIEEEVEKANMDKNNKGIQYWSCENKCIDGTSSRICAFIKPSHFVKKLIQQIFKKPTY